MTIILFFVGVFLWAISEFIGSGYWKPTKVYLSDFRQKISGCFKSKRDQ